ncbi:MAG TPA: NADH-quinone oxidoreductase subunit J [Bdellovibrionota bacterium]|nr:NADH-quinone oxidoreductase subunit J [Bdellovibrionota bacterium]
MIPWVFAALTLLAAVVASFAQDLRRSNLALWVAGLSAGALYLTLGAELLAIVQWIVSTLVTISLLFFSSMYGSSQESRKPGEPRSFLRRCLPVLLPMLLGLTFAAIIWHGGGHLPDESLAVPQDGSGLQALGKALTEKHLLSLEVLALTLFLVLIGGGVVARPEDPDGERGSA